MTDRISTDELRKLLTEATQGPWRLGRWPFFQGDDGRLTCRVYTECPATEMESYGTLCVENARLIAAAPDLAAEVIRLREALEKIERHYTDTGLAAMHMAAIARAALNHKETE